MIKNSYKIILTLLFIANLSAFVYDKYKTNQTNTLYLILNKEYLLKDSIQRIFLKKVAYDNKNGTNYLIHRYDSIFTSYLNLENLNLKDIYELNQKIKSIKNVSMPTFDTIKLVDTHYPLLDNSILRLKILQKKFEVIQLAGSGYHYYASFSLGPAFRILKTPGLHCDSLAFGHFENIFKYKVTYNNESQLYFTDFIKIPKKHINHFSIESMGPSGFKKCEVRFCD